ncbi:MAG: HAD-IIIA family hydrolase [Bacteroidales bacterium]|nr:HAD-IIIA family hydrolase [Bacteroidales bacterium]
MKAVIFTNLESFAYLNPSNEILPMCKVGGKPILEHQVCLLQRYQIKDIYFIVNHHKEEISKYFKDGAKWNVFINYVDSKAGEGNLGILREIAPNLNENFLVLFGNTILELNIDKLHTFHNNHDGVCSITLHPQPSPAGHNLFDIDSNNCITSFFGKPNTSPQFYRNLTDAKVYLCSPALLDELHAGLHGKPGSDFIPSLIKQNKVYGYLSAEYIKSVSGKKELETIDKHYHTGRIRRSNYDFRQKAIFLDRDGVINVERSYIRTPEEFELYPFTAEAVKKINQSEYKSIVVTNQSAIARKMCTLEELAIVHNKMESELGLAGAFINAIHYCPHHPDKSISDAPSQYNIDCDCRKPKPGMLLQASKNMNIDLSKSFMIGDTERDIAAGFKAGCTTVGVMTGYGLKKSLYQPDFLFENIKEAVDFIIDEPYRWVYDKLQNKKRRVPELILIGGKARSGKSTLASYLKWKFNQNGKAVCKIELDSWIIPEDEREHCKNVYDRYSPYSIVSDVQQVLAGIGIRKPRYPKHPDREPIEQSLRYQGEDVIIIEGVVALSYNELRQLATRKIFVEINEKEHIKRFASYYRWRGKTDVEITDLYKERSNDEFGIIDEDVVNADIIVKTDYSG